MTQFRAYKPGVLQSLANKEVCLSAKTRFIFWGLYQLSFDGANRVTERVLGRFSKKIAMKKAPWRRSFGNTLNETPAQSHSFRGGSSGR